MQLFYPRDNFVHAIALKMAALLEEDGREYATEQLNNVLDTSEVDTAAAGVCLPVS